MKIISGNLIAMALDGEFDVIAHGCNCFCLQGAGIAKQMVESFQTHTFPLEHPTQKGNIHKLGQIESRIRHDVIVANCYTQYQPGKNLNKSALELTMLKLNEVFIGRRIGLPLIGCGIAGGDKKFLFKILESFNNNNITVVEWKK